MAKAVWLRLQWGFESRERAPIARTTTVTKLIDICICCAAAAATAKKKEEEEEEEEDILDAAFYDELMQELETEIFGEQPQPGDEGGCEDESMFASCMFLKL